MQRMSDMLSRWLDGANRSSEGGEGEGNEAAAGQAEVSTSIFSAAQHICDD